MPLVWRTGHDPRDQAGALRRAPGARSAQEESTHQLQISRRSNSRSRWPKIPNPRTWGTQLPQLVRRWRSSAKCGRTCTDCTGHLPHTYNRVGTDKVPESTCPCKWCNPPHLQSGIYTATHLRIHNVELALYIVHVVHIVANPPTPCGSKRVDAWLVVS